MIEQDNLFYHIFFLKPIIKLMKTILSLLITLSIIGCTDNMDELNSFKLCKYTSSLPDGTYSSQPFHCHESIDDPTDYLMWLYQTRGIDIFYVGGLETYNRTINDQYPGHSIRYDYILCINMDNGSVSDTLFFKDCSN